MGLLQRLRGARSTGRPTHVVPLGLSCRVAYQVRSYFASATAHPFDWWLTPIQGLTSYLANPEPQRVFGDGALAALELDGRISTIVAPEFGFQLYHDFPRHDVGRPPRAVVPDWRLHVAEARERHARRLERLLALNRRGNRLLFVRDRLDVEGGAGNASPTRALAQLAQILIERWPQAEVELLVINAPRLPPDLPAADRLPRLVRQIDFDDPPGPPPEAWRGEAARWADAFARAGHTRPAPPNGVAPAVGPPD
jgi:hypothetical protein